jgi:leukotriene-A4 hydrolase
VVNEHEVKWDVADRSEPYGSPLSIHLTTAVPKDEEIQVDISLSTSENCTALQWLTPAQTPNGKKPYMCVSL